MKLDERFLPFFNFNPGFEDICNQDIPNMILNSNSASSKLIEFRFWSNLHFKNTMQFKIPLYSNTMQANFDVYILYMNLTFTREINFLKSVTFAHRRILETIAPKLL